MASGAREWWASKGNKGWVAAAVLLCLAHVSIKYFSPEFTPPASANKPMALRAGLYGEFFVHLAVLGAVITAITRRIVALNPKAADDQPIDIKSPLVFQDRSTPWGTIVLILVEFIVYLIIWAYLYQII